MTTTPLDAAELGTWLTRVTQTIDRSLRDTVRTGALAMLRLDLDTTTASVPVLAQLALLDDCLRVAHQAMPGPDISNDELERVTSLVSVAARKYFQVLPAYESFDDGIESTADVARFLTTHREDRGAFGFANRHPWRGLELARYVEATTRNAAPLRDHERMVVRVMDTAFEGARRRPGSSDAEYVARKRLRDLFERPAPSGKDPRAIAFCRGDAPEVFSSVAHGSQIHERDPFDVESIHAETREVFHRQVMRATTPEQHSYGHGRTLLLLGDAGAGKTHLLRALRHQVHSQRLGYVGYLQMSSEVGDYARYVLRNLIDSLERPYDAPGFAESGLLYLSDGLAEGRGIIPADELAAARDAVLGSDELEDLIGRMVDRVLRAEGLGHLEPAIVQALLLLQRRDPAVQRRVIRFLRCEHLGAYEQRMLGGLAPRLEPDDPMRTIRQLGTIAYELQLASLVLLVDQVEDAVPDGKTVTRLQQAIDTLRGVADSVPSAVVVLSCLEDVYTAVRSKLTQSVIDRLERDPAPVRLASQRARSEIEQMLVRRLDHLYATFDVDLQEDDATYPFTSEQLDAVTNYRARDAIAKFREFHEACITAHEIAAPVGAGPTPVEPQPVSNDQLDRAWNDALASGVDLPGDDEGVLSLVGAAVRAAATELDLDVAVGMADDQLVVDLAGKPRRVIELCNDRPQGGLLGTQLDRLRELADDDNVIPIALRNSDFAFKPKSKINRQVGKFIQAGGRTVVLEERQLRAVLAARTVEEAYPDVFGAWQRVNRPLSHLGFVRAILDVDDSKRVMVNRDTAPLQLIERRPASPTGPMPSQPIEPIVDPAKIRIGEATTMRKESVELDVAELAKHVAIVGSPGSGTTHAALVIVEQVLERDISAIVVDRSGQLARYADPAFYRDASAADRERRITLRSRMDVEVITPGNAHGNPLRLPVIPHLADASSQERDQLAAFAAAGLTAMMGYGTGATHRHKQSVLQCAIGLHAEDTEVTLDALRATIEAPDLELLARVGPLQRYFKPLAEDLHTLHIQRGHLFSRDLDPLDIHALVPPPGKRPRLSIIDTTGLGDVAVVQFWVSRLISELGRLARKRPSASLQAVAMFDGADAYLPHTGTPATKEPLHDLLRRARTAGIGVILASDAAAELDYKSRDAIATWLVGKVDRGADKLRHLLASYPTVTSLLADQPPGHFVMLSGATAREVHVDAPMMSQLRSRT